MPDTFLSWGHRRDKFFAPMDLTYIFQNPQLCGAVCDWRSLRKVPEQSLRSLSKDVVTYRLKS